MLKMKFSKICLFCLLFSSSYATEVIVASDETETYGSSSKGYEEKYFSGPEYTLSAQEKEAIKIAADFRKNSNLHTKPIAGQAGEIIYVYGAQSLDIVCAVLQVCDIALQPGEQINTLHLGDSTRWILDPAITGSGSDEIQHIIVKPRDVGLITNLVVTTNRRTYHINLASHRTDYMPAVSFVYPDEISTKFSRKKTAQYSDYSAQNNKNSSSESVSIDNLDFNYKIDSDGQNWTPVRVYNNSRQTVIELPAQISSSEIPTLTVLDSVTDENLLINYRYIGNKFIVDAVFAKAVLIMGVGSNQQTVTITKN